MMLPELSAGARKWPENMDNLNPPMLEAVWTEKDPDAARKCAVAPLAVWSTGKAWYVLSVGVPVSKSNVALWADAVRTGSMSVRRLAATRAMRFV